MLVMTGGRERSLQDFEGLLRAAGFQLMAVHALDDFRFVLEAAVT